MLGDYHLLLAHDVVAHPDEYREVYFDNWDAMFAKGEAPLQYIIMDNSLIELGHPAPMEMMLDAYKIMQPDVIVLPDYLGDMRRTVGASIDFYKDMVNEYYMADGQDIPEVLGVVQGDTIDECMYCARALVDACKVAALAVPRVLREKLGSRMLIATMLGYKYPKIPIHLLGFSTDLIDDVATARLSHVMGIDSAVPIRAAIRNMPMRLDFEGEFDPGPRLDYWDRKYDWTYNQDVLSDVQSNMAKYRRWIDAQYRR
jgi:hypothetical protein